MRLANRLVTATILLTVVAGPPLLAASWLIEHPLTRPTRTEIDAWLQNPLTPETIIVCCGGVAGVAWLLLLAYLGRRALRRVHLGWRRLRRMPLPTPAQVTASSMAGVAAFTLPGAVSVDAGSAAPAVAQQLPESRAGADGITLPGGGWIPYPTAIAVTAVTSLVWLHRRRHYRPGPPCSHADDPGLQPLPATVAAVSAADLPAGPVALNPPPAGILALTGPGAAAAARGLLVTAVLAAATDNNTYRVRVSEADLLSLLPGTDLTTADGTLLVLDNCPTASARWHVAVDGTVTGSPGAPKRVCVLGEQEARDLIALAGHLHAGAVEDTAPRTPPAAHPAPQTTDAPARLELLGRCRLTVGGQEIRLRRSAGSQILAYLAIHPAGAEANELVQACWPGIPPATITQRLHTTVSDLRKQLQPLLGADPIHRIDHRYRLNTRAVDTDLRAWRDAVQAAAAHPAGSARQLTACREVVDLYDGELAAGHQWAWLTPARETLRREVLDAYVVLADHAEPAHAVTLIQQALAVDPYNEDLHERAARVAQAIGDYSDVAGSSETLRRWNASPPG
ncbi:hypothetical protein AB0F81_38035 [Actinoplanes sp. NPDC024001]|uniref:AfsR/SARP family transcriptional regulator n=1 Tax=Actinoplanes sp. NPDC024001 TaxID=3154598 RepID=UPI0034023A04